jgi:hypothetical protein
MLETAVILDLDSQPIFWHMPHGRTSVHIPDSHNLWDIIWNNRSIISAIAHSHPGKGKPSPSHEDLTTFSAIEAALGKKLLWPIITEDDDILCYYIGPGKYDYARYISVLEKPWIDELRRLSYG